MFWHPAKNPGAIENSRVAGTFENSRVAGRFENARVAGTFENCEVTSRMGKTTELSALRCSMVAGCLGRLSGDLLQGCNSNNLLQQFKCQLYLACKDQGYKL